MNRSTSESASDDLVAALGRVTSGVYVLTVARDGAATGMLASWVMQAGFDPPTLTVALAAGRPALRWIDSGETFVLNVIGQGQTGLLKHFGRGFAPGEPAFEGVPTEPVAGCDAPALVDAIATLVCRPTGSGIDTTDHRVVAAEVLSGRVRVADPPMAHHRKRGDRY